MDSESELELNHGTANRLNGLGLLRVVICGGVDDGKSTLAGCMLREAQQICEDQAAAPRPDSQAHGTQGDYLDSAFLADDLAAEREQGPTVDVAYRFFATERRKFIVADTPGHERYTRNMIAGASTAGLAILLVDARHGVLAQTRRHACLASLMGIRHVVLAVNKMDLDGFDQEVFRDIEHAFRTFARGLNFSEIVSIPLSALRGDNVLVRSPDAPWYAGPTLLEYLESVEIRKGSAHGLVFPVQGNRPNLDFRGFAGTVAEGRVAVGDTVRIMASGQTAQVARIVTMDRDLDSAAQGQTVTLVLDRELGISRGDVIGLAQSPLEVTDQFEATVVWMHKDPGLAGRTYDLRLATQWTPAAITSVSHRINIDTQAREAAKTLDMNDICVCKLSTGKPVAFDSFASSPTLGSFILVDRLTRATVGAGMIRHSLRRAQNVHRQAYAVSRADREKLNGHAGMLFWFTGYSGSGKSTLANALEASLHADGFRTYILDGDNVRHGLNKDLGFTDADRVENIRRVAEVAKLMVDAGLIVITAFISPFRSEREFVRSLFDKGQFVEVFVDTPLELCERRDPKGLYKKARTGLLPNMTGIGSPYEPPETAEIHLKMAEQSVEACVAILRRGYGNS